MNFRRFLRKRKRQLLRRIDWRKKWRFPLDYQPEPGRRSAKAERLIDFCLGDFKERPVEPCTQSRHYLQHTRILALEADRRQIVLSARATARDGDQKEIVRALITQRAAIPPGLSSWLIYGDGAGRNRTPEEGLHITGMRQLNRRDLVLVPTADRERYLGPNLKRQMDELRQAWVPWGAKTDSAWWGGALTGDRWVRDEPRTLTRREVLTHFRDDPSDQVSLHPTELSNGAETPPGIQLESSFSKRSAFSHKCLLLLPGNDIASGSSWYFAGNSVVMMPKPHLDHILYFEMEPWEHYVPLENDPADILVKLRWVLENEDEAQRIVASSHERLRWLCGPEYLWACNEVLLRITHP
jgi:hypothetical protein